MAEFEVRFKQERIYSDTVKAETQEEAEQIVLEESQGWSAEVRSYMTDYIGPIEII